MTYINSEINTYSIIKIKEQFMTKEKTFESKEILKTPVDTANPNEVITTIEKILNTPDDPKMKLFVLGELLEQNKNQTIYTLKGEIETLRKRISNQRKYINKIKKSLKSTQVKAMQTTNTLNSISQKIDNAAYQKAQKDWDNQHKKVYYVRKKK